MTLRGRPGWLTDSTPVREALNMVHAWLYEQAQQRIALAAQVMAATHDVKPYNRAVEAWQELEGWLEADLEDVRRWERDQREDRLALIARMGDVG